MDKEGETHGEENIKIVVADSVAEIADKMVEYVCEKMDRCSFENQEETVTRNTEEEDKEEALKRFSKLIQPGNVLNIYGLNDKIKLLVPLVLHSNNLSYF